MDLTIMQQNAGDRADPEAQLAADWALFQAVDSGATRFGFRCWQTATPVVVVGRNSRQADDVQEEACRADEVRVVRRFSGGGAVVLGPGSLNYAVAMAFVSRPELTDVPASFSLILGRIVEALDLRGLVVEGGTDLAVEGRKVSGNAQRRGRRALLHHGTMLYGFDPALATRYLREPTRRPAYRGARQHSEFIGNIPLDAATIRARLERALSSLAVDRSHDDCLVTGHMHKYADVRFDFNHSS